MAYVQTYMILTIKSLRMKLPFSCISVSMLTNSDCRSCQITEKYDLTNESHCVCMCVCVCVHEREKRDKLRVYTGNDNGKMVI